MLQEYCQEKDIPKPEYKTVNDIIFDDNSHEFTVRCILNGRYTEGKGERVKEAKKEAAYGALCALLDYDPEQDEEYFDDEADYLDDDD